MKDFKVKKPNKILSYVVADKFSLTMLIIFGILFNIGLLALPIYEGQLAQALYDVLNNVSPFKNLLWLGIEFFVVMILVQITRHFKRYFARSMSNMISAKLRKSLYNFIVYEKQTEIDEESVGSFLTKTILDIDTIAEGFRRVSQEVFDTGVLMVAFIVTLFVYDVKLALISLIFVPIIYVISMLFRKKVERAATAHKKTAEDVNNATFERLGAATLFRVYSRDSFELEKYSQKLKAHEKTSVKTTIYENALLPIYKIIVLIGVIFIVYFGARNVLGLGWAVWDIATFTTFNLCFAKIADKTSKGAKLFNAYQKAKVSWERVKPMLKTQSNLDETTSIDFEKPAYMSINGLNFSYLEGRKIIKDLSFDVAQGEILGVTGAVASGKTTLGKVFLLEREYQGEVKICGKELKDLTEFERFNYVSYLGHNSELFSGTVEENIALGDQIDVDYYLKICCLYDELNHSGIGKDTVIGNRGVRLSGGQQARLALARTLAHAKKIVILDDPFSAVDKNTENQIFKNIKDLMQDKILILISHRLTLFPNFDKVIYLKDGSARVSTHQELVLDQDYRELYFAQCEVKDEK